MERTLALALVAILALAGCTGANDDERASTGDPAPGGGSGEVHGEITVTEGGNSTGETNATNQTNSTA